MTTATEAIRTVLVSFAGLQSLLATTDSPAQYRVYSLVMPQDSDYPTIVMEKASQLRENTMAASGGAGVDNQRCRFNIYSDSLSECEAVAEQLRLALVGAASTDFNAVQVFELDNYESDTHLYRIIVDYSIWYRH